MKLLRKKISIILILMVIGSSQTCAMIEPLHHVSSKRRIHITKTASPLKMLLIGSLLIGMPTVFADTKQSGIVTQETTYGHHQPVRSTKEETPNKLDIPCDESVGVHAEAPTKNIDSKKKQNTNDDYYGSLLVMAIANNEINVAQSLLQKVANIDTPGLGELKITALGVAVKRGHHQMCKELLARGANVNVADADGITPFHRVVESNNLKLLREFLVHLKDTSSLSENILKHTLDDALEYAALLKDKINLAISRELLEYGANPNNQQGLNPTALIIAASTGNTKLCRLLLEYRANPKATDNTKSTALHFASERGYLEICKILLEHRADVNAHNEKKNSPLLLAAQKGHLKVCQLLLDSGADVNAANERGFTPLTQVSIFADSQIYVQIRDLLLARGASLTYTESFALTVVKAATTLEKWLGIKLY